MGHRQQKEYILDTNVLVHDPQAVLKFGEHIVAIPLKVVEELDRLKEGSKPASPKAREAIHLLNTLSQNYSGVVKTGCLVAQIQLNGLNLLTQKYGAVGQLYLQTTSPKVELPFDLDYSVGDHSILRYVVAEKERRGRRPVILVTKDDNLRFKARILGITVQDYRNESVSLDDVDVFKSTGIESVSEAFLKDSERGSESHGKRGVLLRLEHSSSPNWYTNQGLVTENGTLYRVLSTSDTTSELLRLHDWTRKNREAFGIHPQNLPQAYAMHLCLDPSLPVVFLGGIAGSGKTLIALASGLQQVLEDKLYNSVIATRVTVPAGEEIGFLPGSEREKMDPWMGAIADNLEVITEGWETDKGIPVNGTAVALKKESLDRLWARIELKSMSFMRGRTFLRRYVLLDEAQNLTPQQLGYLLARLGPGSKAIVMGNVRQIDTAYLKETDNGLTVWVKRFKSSNLGAHVVLQGSVRSPVADFVESFY